MASVRVGRGELLRAALTGDARGLVERIVREATRPGLGAEMPQGMPQGMRADGTTTDAVGTAGEVSSVSVSALSAYLRQIGVSEADFAELPRGESGISPAATRLYAGAPFAQSWYGARERGEQIRAAALSALYSQRARPGGRFPDPRESGVFSARAVLGTAATQLGVKISLMPLAVGGAGAAVGDGNSRTPRRARASRIPPAVPQAWILTYPDGPFGRRLPDIAVRAVPTSAASSADELAYAAALPLFSAACALGYFARLRDYLLDPAAPRGSHPLPADPSARSLLHQFAFALLCLRPPVCPGHWRCHCAHIRQRLNAAPPDHPQRTEELAVTMSSSPSAGTPQPRLAGEPAPWWQDKSLRDGAHGDDGGDDDDGQTSDGFQIWGGEGDGGR